MNAELLLEHFHRLGDATDAVPRLRHFILDLAVRGKLVEHEPGSAFVYLSELCTSRSGNSTIIKGKISAEPGEGLYPAFSASGQDVWHSSYEHEGDAVIVSAVGARCGKAFLATGKWSAIANTHILFPKADRCTLSYLHLIANNEALWIRGGSAQPFVRVSKTLEAREVYLPTFPEQHRIVAKVEELMALCDRLEAAQQQREAERTRLTAAAWEAVVQADAPAEVSFALEQLHALTTRRAQVKALRQTILDLAVSGRLVEQVEGEGSGAETLAEVKRLRKELVEERRIRGGKDTEYVDAILDVPASWATPYVADVAIVLGGKRIPKGLTFSETPTPHIYIRVTDMKDGTIRTEGLKYITPEVQRTISQYTINKEDLYITIAGTIGSVGRVPEFFDGQNLTENAAKIVFRGIDPDYFRMALSTQQVQDQFTDKIKQMAQPKLAIKRVMGSRFPLPPLAEQRRIVAKVEELMALCDGLEAALQAGEALRGKVLEAVVRSETGGTEPPAPVPLRQLPVPKVRAPRYEEAEVELAVAAEPVGPAGALQALVRRGPGRPPKNGALTSTAARAIEAWLQAHPGWHGKAAILEATGVDAGAWNAAIKELLEAGKVERQGEKKGARYRGR